jgi:hypothetical protein
LAGAHAIGQLLLRQPGVRARANSGTAQIPGTEIPGTGNSGDRTGNSGDRKFRGQHTYSPTPSRLQPHHEFWGHNT